MKFLNWMGVERDELTVATLRADIDWTWLLLLAAFIFLLGLLRGGM